MSSCKICDLIYLEGDVTGKALVEWEVPDAFCKRHKYSYMKDTVLIAVWQSSWLSSFPSCRALIAAELFKSMIEN